MIKITHPDLQFGGSKLVQKWRKLENTVMIYW